MGNEVVNDNKLKKNIGSDKGNRRSATQLCCYEKKLPNYDYSCMQ